VLIIDLKLELEKLPLKDLLTQLDPVMLPTNEPDANVADPEIYRGFLGLVFTLDNLPVKLAINDVFGITEDVRLKAYHLLPE
jgi:hypothetical protein